MSMDGRGRALDHLFTERFWGSLKSEEVYLNAYRSHREAWPGVARYLTLCNTVRPHQAFGYRTLAAVHASASQGQGG